MIESLNLPKAPLQLKRKQQEVFVTCLIRNKDLLLTPEEWVRQHVLHAIHDAGISYGRMTVENGLKYNQLMKRTDAILLDSFGKPLLIIECKAPNIKLAIDVFQQYSNYQSVLNAPFGLITNGMSHMFINVENNQYDEISTSIKFKQFIIKHLLNYTI